MAKKSGKDRKSGKSGSAGGFSFGGFDIPAALKESGVTVENLARHPLVAGLAAMALETLAGQIRARAAAHNVADPHEEEADEPPAPKAKARKPAATKPATAKPAAAKKAPARKPAARNAPTRKTAPRKPAS